MSRFRALLLGVAEYDDPGIESLPCVRSDITKVSTALEARGYSVEGTENNGRIGRTRLLSTVRRYLDSGRPGDTLIVYLSGHGVYQDGMTYLVPTDADLSYDTFAEVAVPLGAWTGKIDNSKAAGILFLVDACREGFTESKSVTARTAWSAEKIARAERHHVAWIFPCAEGQVARYVAADGGDIPEPFSLFAQSVVSALADPVAPGTLEGFASSIRANMELLTRKHGKGEQQIRVITNGRNDVAPFVLFPTGAREPRSWEQAHAGHPAWKRFAETPESQALIGNVGGLIRHLARMRYESGAVTRDDPWVDEGFALRMSRQTSFLLSSVLGDLTLSPAEAALLVVAPYVHDTHWAIQRAKVAQVLSPDLDRSSAADEQLTSFDRYIQGYPRFRRKTGQLASHAELGWWFLHRWLAGQVAAYAEDELAALLRPAAWGGGPLAVDILSQARLRQVIRAIRADNGFFAAGSDLGGLSPVVVVAGGRAGEQKLRERLVGLLVVIAHRLAIEAPFLSDVIPDHLGTADPVVPAELHATLENAKWEPLGHARILTAACGHPAVEIALREHVAELDGLLAHLHAQAGQSWLGGLSRLPARALADRVGPADRGGKRAYDSAGTRFRLAEDRVQELLMGEQLYGKSAAAIRELYQNALDACRYRKARTEFLIRTGHQLEDWTGSIRFVRETDEQGRDYLDCTDTGIGMGRRELSEVFARAGVRFAELPEFLEEKYEWDRLDPPVEFIPNSRFGVGVLSYFMLADEITVDTCRFEPDGTPGEHLRVTVAGPGSLFRIRSLGPGSEAGTTVRLYLNPGSAPESCRQVLGDVLKVADYATEVIEGGNRRAWAPGVLTASRSYGPGPAKAADGSPVWWVADGGMLLVDGVLADSEATISGAVVNLTGEQVRLSVDRTKIISLSDDVLDKMLSAAIPELFTENYGILALRWLWQLSRDRPAIADQVFTTALQKGVTDCGAFNGRFDLAAGGCFPEDQFLSLDSGRWRAYYKNGYEGTLPDHITDDCPDNVATWRLASLAAAGVRLPSRVATALQPAAPAMPSDATLLRTSDPGYVKEWLDSTAPVTAGRILKAAESLGRSVPDVTERLRLLGYVVPDAAAIEADRILASTNLDGKARWRTSTSRMSLLDLSNLARKMGISHDEAVARLRRLGYDALPRIDLILVSQDLDGTYPWRAAGSAVPATTILRAADELGIGEHYVAHRYRQLGYDVASTDDDMALAALELMDGQPLWQIRQGRIWPEWVSWAARKLGRTTDDVARRLRSAGYVVRRID